MNTHRARCRCFSNWYGRCRSATPSWRATRSPDCARMRLRRAPQRPPPKPEVARAGGACLRDHGGTGPLAILIPSLINPPRILDLDREVSLAAAIAGMGRRVLLLDWGEARGRSELERLRDISRNCCCRCCAASSEPAGADRLLPRRDDGDRRRQPRRSASASSTLAAPWNFARYPRTVAGGACRRCGAIRKRPRDALGRAADGSAAGGLLVARPGADGAPSSPSSAGSIPHSADARALRRARGLGQRGRAPALPRRARADRRLLRRATCPAAGRWTVGGRAITDRLAAPLLHLHRRATTGSLRPSTAPAGETVGIPSGHVGMIVGSARAQLHRRAEALP